MLLSAFFSRGWSIGPRPEIAHSSLKPLISLVLHNTQLHCFRDRIIAMLSIVFTANPVRPCKDLDRLLLPVHSYPFLFENGDFFPPVWRTVYTYSVKAVTIFESATLLYSCGWKKTVVYGNDCVTVLDPAQRSAE